LNEVPAYTFPFVYIKAIQINILYAIKTFYTLLVITNMQYRKIGYFCSKNNVTLLVDVPIKRLILYYTLWLVNIIVWFVSHRHIVIITIIPTTIRGEIWDPIYGGGRVSFRRSNPVSSARAHVGAYTVYYMTWPHTISNFLNILLICL